MNELSKRLENLSPEQRELLARRLRAKGVNLPGAEAAADALPQARHVPEARRAQGMQFSLLFFSGDGTTETQGKYDFLLECARFADAHGFRAIWTPERHFQAFGGLFPNPSVLSAALAMVTERLQIRAGSVVVPLHNPIRLAEEWAVVDNLSNGRVAISLATGWNRGDFTIMPAHFDDRRAIAFDNLATIRRLWRGECVSFAGVDGEAFEVTILPKPLQPELPVWVTASGSPQTWIDAGAIGANILTAIGRNPDDLVPSITSYREAREKHGHDPQAGIVSVMMHTFLGEDEALVKQQVRGPLSGYLKTFIAQDEVLSREETGVEAQQISERDREEMINFAFERYFQQAALFGTPQKCARMVEWMQAVDVDEIACLVDFGADHDAVRASFQHLSQLREQFSPDHEKQV
nr:KrmP [uncultured bacterium]